MNHAQARSQCAGSILMIRPASFGFNSETAPTNAFQTESREERDIVRNKAREEFDAVARSLGEAGVDVIVFDDRAQPAAPDAVFPNNWISTHEDGTVVLYPMSTPNRRLERRADVIDRLESEHGFAIRRVIDLAHNELRGRYLEGTGSVVFDHINRIAYACISERTNRGMLYELDELLGYRSVAFHATDAAGVAVYHTNVVMSICQDFVMVCVDAIDDERQREDVIGRLQASDRELVRLDRSQMASFAANVLELRSGDAQSVLAVSERAWGALTGAQRAQLEKWAAVVTVPIPTIESVGGGSIRCMIAEIFLPRTGACSAPGQSRPSD